MWLILFLVLYFQTEIMIGYKILQFHLETVSVHVYGHAMYTEQKPILAYLVAVFRTFSPNTVTRHHNDQISRNVPHVPL